VGYVVVLLACMANPPGDCVDQPLELPEIHNESACTIAGRLAVNAWREAHPGMKVLQAQCAGPTPRRDAGPAGRGAGAEAQG
jgi:hypothetical protein